jgi:hypothetical protein
MNRFAQKFEAFAKVQNKPANYSNRKQELSGIKLFTYTTK